MMDDEQNYVKIATKDDIKAFRKNHPFWFVLVFVLDLGLVILVGLMWIYISFRIGQVDANGHVDNDLLFAIPFMIGFIGAMIAAIGLAFITTQIYHKFIPDYPEEYIGSKAIATMIAVGLSICVICALIMYFVLFV